MTVETGETRLFPVSCVRLECDFDIVYSQGGSRVALGTLAAWGKRSDGEDSGAREGSQCESQRVELRRAVRALIPPARR